MPGPNALRIGVTNVIFLTDCGSIFHPLSGDSDMGGIPCAQALHPNEAEPRNRRGPWDFSRVPALPDSAGVWGLLSLLSDDCVQGVRRRQSLRSPERKGESRPFKAECFASRQQPVDNDDHILYVSASGKGMHKPHPCKPIPRSHHILPTSRHYAPIPCIEKVP
jgi:hypothetical protein